MISTSNKKIDFFSYGNSTASTNLWFTWIKPKNAKFCHFIIQGAGGGGGRVANGAANQGGAGGGGGATIRAYVCAALLPQVLYIRPGIGGEGASTASTVGTAGTPTIINVEPVTTSWIFSASGGGGGGVQTPAGTAGTAQSTFYGLANFFLYDATNGTAGAIGSNSVNGGGSSATFSSTVALGYGGSGGGCGSGAGGNCSNNNAPFNLTLFGGTGSTGGNGLRGFTNIDKFQDYGISYTGSFLYNSGGTGGGGHTTGTAGNGGDGSYGCGGGGGGGCNNAAGTSGNGGKGGDGYVLIYSY